MSKTHQFSSVQSLSHVWLFATPWIAARQASLSITDSWSSLRLTSIQSVMPSSHLILCPPLLLLPPIPPSIRIFSSESALRMRWPKYWSFSLSIIPSKEHPGLISFRMDRLDLLAVQGTLKSILQCHSSKALILLHSAFFTVQLSHPYMTTGKDSDAGRDWGQEEKGRTEDEMAGWHHRLDGRESEWTPGVGDGQGGLACCNSWGRKESDTTERLIWTEHKKVKGNVSGSVVSDSCDRMYCNPPGSSVHGILQARILMWLEKGGRGVQDGGHMYICGWFMYGNVWQILPMCGKTTTIL